MSSAATRASNSPYDGPLILSVGHPLLPARYAVCSSWEAVAQTIGADLNQLRALDAALFSALAHTIADRLSQRDGEVP